jgi:SAM-dependent methyltransferase
MLKRIKQLIPRDFKIGLVYRAIRLRGMLDFGDTVECNICNKSFGRFADFNQRINVLCPNCFSLERHRLQFEYLRRHTGIFTDPLRVLHFAPEKCMHDQIARNVSLEYHTADLMTHFIELIEVRPRHRMSVTEIEFPDDHFDMVICNHLLEHVKDDLRAMAELYRVTKQEGLLLAQVPINVSTDEVFEDFTLSEAQRAILYGSRHHVRYYSERGFTERLRSVGFSVEVNPLCESLDHGRLRLMRSENLYIMRKPRFAATSETAATVGHANFRSHDAQN